MPSTERQGRRRGVVQDSSREHTDTVAACTDHRRASRTKPCPTPRPRPWANVCGLRRNDQQRWLAAWGGAPTPACVCRQCTTGGSQGRGGRAGQGLARAATPRIARWAAVCPRDPCAGCLRNSSSTSAERVVERHAVHQQDLHLVDHVLLAVVARRSIRSTHGRQQGRAQPRLQSKRSLWPIPKPSHAPPLLRGDAPPSAPLEDRSRRSSMPALGVGALLAAL